MITTKDIEQIFNYLNKEYAKGSLTLQDIFLEVVHYYHPDWNSTEVYLEAYDENIEFDDEYVVKDGLPLRIRVEEIFDKDALQNFEGRIKEHWSDDN